jgi:phasin family protein
MSNTDQNKPTSKPGQRNRKAEQRRQKAASQQGPRPDQPRSPEPDQLLSPEPDQLKSPEPNRQPDARARIGAVVASTEAAVIPAVAPPEASPVSAAAPATAGPVSMQTIANAYRDYTRKSFEETTSFVEKLTGVRSLDKAMEIQTEFAKQAYATFVTQSQKICELHSELAKQTFKPLQRLVSKTSPDPR